MKVSNAKESTIFSVGFCSKGFFLKPFFNSQEKNGMNYFIMDLELLNNLITCTKFKMTKQMKEAIHHSQCAVLQDTKLSHSHILVTKWNQCFTHSERRPRCISSVPSPVNSAKKLYKAVTVCINNAGVTESQSTTNYMNDTINLSIPLPPFGGKYILCDVNRVNGYVNHVLFQIMYLTYTPVSLLLVYKYSVNLPIFLRKL